jgi:hypothetical protein
MITEWLLIFWVGTTTNFTLISWHNTKESCLEARKQLTRLDKKYIDLKDSIN